MNYEGKPEKKDSCRICLILSNLILFILFLLCGAALSFYAVQYYLGGQCENGQCNSSVKMDMKCDSKQCVQSANGILLSIDTSIDPCEDFYEFSCKNWENGFGLPSDHFSKSDEYIRDVIKDLLKNKEINTDSFLKMKTFYDACLDLASRENISSFTGDLLKLGNWPLLVNSWNDTDWISLTSKLHNMGFTSHYIIAVNSQRDNLDNRILRLTIDQPIFGLKEPEYYNVSSNESDSKRMDVYFDYIHSLAHALSGTKLSKNQSKDIEDALAVEVELAKMSNPLSYLRDPDTLYNHMTFGELRNQTPMMNWDQFIDIYVNRSISPDEVIIVPSITVIQNITNYLYKLNSTLEGRRKLANYIMYRLVIDSSSELNQEFNHIATDHTSLDVDMEKQCIDNVQSYFQIALLSGYQKIYPEEEKINAILDLVSELKKELAEILYKTTWMDDKTRQEAIAKVNLISPKIEFPDGIKNDSAVSDWYKELNVGKNHFENCLQVQDFLTKKQELAYDTNVTMDSSNWSFLSEDYVSTNAFYEPDKNDIIITLGISSEFYFNHLNPIYINYGRLGMIIGHELTHSLDQTGSKFDSKGNEHNWWLNTTMAEYQNQSQCLIDVFDRFYDNTTGLYVNGEQTLQEATADTVGCRQSYNAFIKKSQTTGVQKLPGLPYTPNQLFWISYGTGWCEKVSKSALQYTILFNEHPPNKYRVNGLVENNINFANDFNCKLGSPMNPSSDKCLIFGK